MLLNKFFAIDKLEVSSDKSTCSVRAILNPEHPIFNGHFPGNPIVPGVCMLQMIKEILAKILKHELMLVKSNAIKLNNLISPVKNPVIDFEIHIRENTSGMVQISSRIYFGNTTFCNFKGTFKI